MDWIISESLCI